MIFQTAMYTFLLRYDLDIMIDVFGQASQSLVGNVSIPITFLQQGVEGLQSLRTLVLTDAEPVGRPLEKAVENGARYC